MMNAAKPTEPMMLTFRSRSESVEVFREGP